MESVVVLIETVTKRTACVTQRSTSWSVFRW